jgi:hypothetical protein
MQLSLLDTDILSEFLKQQTTRRSIFEAIPKGGFPLYLRHPVSETSLLPLHLSCPASRRAIAAEAPNEESTDVAVAPDDHGTVLLDG